MYRCISPTLIAAFWVALVCPLPVAGADWIYVVNSGDNLWDLSERYLHNATYWKKLQTLNGVKNPRRMQPGTRLRVPLAWIRSNTVAAVVQEVRGGATLINAASGERGPASAGTELRLGDRLVTDLGASVAVRFADGSSVTLSGESTAVFDHLSAYGDTGMVDSRMRLDRGRIEAKARPAQGPGSRFQIQTPSAVSLVRGTRYRASVDESEASSLVEVVGGRVAVTGEQRTQIVNKGFGTRVGSGKPPQEPRPLLPSPRLEELPGEIERINWPVTWKELPGAQSYRVQLASSPFFETALWEQQVSFPRVPLPDIPDGVYYVRVRGIDGVGLEGLDADAPVVLDARPQPPVPLQPVEGSVIRGEAPSLRWSASSEAGSYRLQIGADPLFSQILEDQAALSTLEFKWGPMAEPGSYFWRLASVAADGEQGPWAPVRAVVVKPIPSGPPTRLAVEKDSIVAAWQEGAPGQTYRVQLAEDQEFETLVLDQPSKASSLRIDPVRGTARYLRVAVVEPDGYQGPWGATQRIDPEPDSSWLWIVVPGLLAVFLL